MKIRIYRTPTMLGLLLYNHLKMKEKALLMYEKKEGFHQENPFSGERGIRTLDTVARILPFQGSSFNHSDTSPVNFFCKTELVSGWQRYIFFKIIKVF